MKKRWQNPTLLIQFVKKGSLSIQENKGNYVVIIRNRGLFNISKHVCTLSVGASM